MLLKSSFKEIFEEILGKYQPTPSDISRINHQVKDFSKLLKKAVSKSNKKTDIFFGGSFAKSTLIKKPTYEIDIFLRFHCNEEEIIKNFSLISSYLKKEFKKKFKNSEFFKAHGSRHYLNLSYDNLIFEIIPTQYIKNPIQAQNSTDLSYFHVKYVNRKLKQKKKLNQEIILAKLFTEACGCYGAESYISGFSGYAIELLVIYYKSFFNFIKAISKLKSKKIIDIEKEYKSEKEILKEMNEAKLDSPIILIDPTFKYRNATSSLSKQTLEKFQKHCNEFLKSSNKDFFFKEEINKKNIEKINNFAKKNNLNLVEIQAKSKTKEENIAGAKLLKFFDLLSQDSKKYIELKKTLLLYTNNNRALFIFAAKPKKEIIFKGPPKDKIKYVKEFKKKHKNTSIKKGRYYAKKSLKFNFNNKIKDLTKKIEDEREDVNILNINFKN
jgi:tRNA nucleotidyltransferase (CCA-adding enzyme)